MAASFLVNKLYIDPSIYLITQLLLSSDFGGILILIEILIARSFQLDRMIKAEVGEGKALFSNALLKKGETKMGR